MNNIYFATRVCTLCDANVRVKGNGDREYMFPHQDRCFKKPCHGGGLTYFTHPQS